MVLVLWLRALVLRLGLRSALLLQLLAFAANRVALVTGKIDFAEALLNIMQAAIMHE